MRKLPNLNAIRAFDAAARNDSFARAADELGVSHAAVSRHIRNLERELGSQLFERHARHVVLTGEGLLFARTAADALSRLELGSGRLRRGGGRSTVVLDVESDLATRWLLPLLTEASLSALKVNLDVRVRPEPPHRVLGDADLAITWGAASCLGFKAQPFLESQAFPVAAPALVAGDTAPRDGRIYKAHRLIHERGLYWWRAVFDVLGLDLEEAAGHLFLNRSHLCVDAAVRGLGLAIGDDLICREALDSGALISLAGPTLPGRDRYYLLTPDTTALSGPVRQVRDWLLEMSERPPLPRRETGTATQR
ncbi:MAG: transcriptional regulator GcvA [Rhodospirillales bacterium]